MYHFKEDPSVLRINIDEECAGDGIFHALYFNQNSEKISYDSNWYSSWNDYQWPSY